MRNTLKCLLIAAISLLLSGCAGAGDYSISLPGDYSLIRSSAHNVTISKKKGDGIWGEALIPAKVTELAWDDKYILAKRLGLKRQYPDNPNNTYEIPDESNVSYWILQVDSGKMYGPFNENEFADKRKELSISSDIVLKSISSYSRD